MYVCVDLEPYKYLVLTSVKKFVHVINKFVLLLMSDILLKCVFYKLLIKTGRAPSNTYFKLKPRL